MWDTFYLATRAAASTLFDVHKATVACRAPPLVGSEHCACGSTFTVNESVGSAQGEQFAIECLTASHLLANGVLLLPHVAYATGIVRLQARNWNSSHSPLSAGTSTPWLVGTLSLRPSGGPYLRMDASRWAGLERSPHRSLQLIGTSDAFSSSKLDVQRGCVGSFYNSSPEWRDLYHPRRPSQRPGGLTSHSLVSDWHCQEQDRGLCALLGRPLVAAMALLLAAAGLLLARRLCAA